MSSVGAFRGQDLQKSLQNGLLSRYENLNKSSAIAHEAAEAKLLGHTTNKGAITDTLHSSDYDNFQIHSTSTPVISTSVPAFDGRPSV